VTDTPGSTGEPQPMWHVTLTVGGDPVPIEQIHAAMERLDHDRPFLLAGRYAVDRAELRYWEEAESLQDAAALALRLWGEHRASAGLPPWEVLGLEVLQWQLFHTRGRAGQLSVRGVGAGQLRPF
jgi:hypothetical protein